MVSGLLYSFPVLAISGDLSMLNITNADHSANLLMIQDRLKRRIYSIKICFHLHLET